MAHTPGPWRYHRDKDTGYALHSYVWGPTVSVHCAGGNLDHYEPDMLLIAAAPDLLDALKEADRALKYYEWYNNPKSGWALPENSSLRGVVEAAIAKAEGRSK